MVRPSSTNETATSRLRAALYHFGGCLPPECGRQCARDGADVMCLPHPHPDPHTDTVEGEGGGGWVEGPLLLYLVATGQAEAVEACLDPSARSTATDTDTDHSIDFTRTNFLDQTVLHCLFSFSRCGSSACERGVEGRPENLSTAAFQKDGMPRYCCPCRWCSYCVTDGDPSLPPFPSFASRSQQQQEEEEGGPCEEEWPKEDDKATHRLRGTCTEMENAEVLPRLLRAIVYRVQTHPGDNINWMQADACGETLLSLAARHQVLSLVWPLVREMPAFADALTPLSLQPNVPDLAGQREERGEEAGDGDGNDDEEEGGGVVRSALVWRWDWEALGGDGEETSAFAAPGAMINGNRVTGVLWDWFQHHRHEPLPPSALLRRCVASGADVLFCHPSLMLPGEAHAEPILHTLISEGNKAAVEICLEAAPPGMINWTKVGLKGRTCLHCLYEPTGGVSRGARLSMLRVMVRRLRSRRRPQGEFYYGAGGMTSRPPGPAAEEEEGERSSMRSEDNLCQMALEEPKKAKEKEEEALNGIKTSWRLPRPVPQTSKREPNKESAGHEEYLIPLPLDLSPPPPPSDTRMPWGARDAGGNDFFSLVAAAQELSLVWPIVAELFTSSVQAADLDEDANGEDHHPLSSNMTSSSRTGLVSSTAVDKSRGEASSSRRFLLSPVVWEADWEVLVKSGAASHFRLGRRTKIVRANHATATAYLLLHALRVNDTATAGAVLHEEERGEMRTATASLSAANGRGPGPPGSYTVYDRLRELVHAGADVLQPLPRLRALYPPSTAEAAAFYSGESHCLPSRTRTPTRTTTAFIPQLSLLHMVVLYADTLEEPVACLKALLCTPKALHFTVPRGGVVSHRNDATTGRTPVAAPEQVVEPTTESREQSPLRPSLGLRPRRQPREQQRLAPTITCPLASMTLEPFPLALLQLPQAVRRAMPSLLEELLEVFLDRLEHRSPPTRLCRTESTTSSTSSSSSSMRRRGDGFTLNTIVGVLGDTPISNEWGPQLYSDEMDWSYRSPHTGMDFLSLAALQGLLPTVWAVLQRRRVPFFLCMKENTG